MKSWSGVGDAKALLALRPPKSCLLTFFLSLLPSLSWKKCMGQIDGNNRPGQLGDTGQG